MTLPLQIQLSLIITCVWAAMQPGMILHPLQQAIDKFIWLFGARAALTLKKPLYDCMFCMTSVWGIGLLLAFGLKVAELFTIDTVTLLLEVGALNFILSSFISVCRAVYLFIEEVRSDAININTDSEE